jgi:pyridoxamine 5'-phosphate oxidase-like protein
MSVAEEFIAVAHRIVYCTLATVDRRGRPRSRLVHPVWRLDGGGLLHGVVGTRPTPLKRAHLAHAPHVSCSYWDPAHDVAVAECDARWVEDVAGRERAWALMVGTAAPVGYDPATIWPDGPSSEEFAVIALEPWRVSVAAAAELARGGRATVWRAQRAPA